MVATTTAKRLTYEDYRDTPDDERWELLNGELVMPPAPNVEHQMVSANMNDQLRAFVKQNALGTVLYAPCDVVLSEHNVVQPDLLFISSERMGIITHANVRGAPDLVVEILSPGSVSRDWRDKLDVYAEHGVREYWIVDPGARRAWVMTLSEAGGFEEAGNYGVGDALESVVLEGFTLALEDVFQPMP